MNALEALESHGPAWRDWLLDNLTKQCRPHDLLVDMMKGGWLVQQAELALSQGQALLNQPASRTILRPTIGPSNQLHVNGQDIRVMSRLTNPQAVVIAEVLSSEECEELIALAMSKGLNASDVVDNDSGERVLHQGRTSTSTNLTKAENTLVARIEQRLADLTAWPVSHGEGLQVLRYTPGQEYRPHFDWFDPSAKGASLHLQNGGQRVATTVIYLRVAEEGGGTLFPEVGFEACPPQGGAVFFNNLDPYGAEDRLSLHAGSPVTRGTKVVCTYWQRERPFQ